MVYVSNLSRPSNLKLVAKQYKVSLNDLEKNLSSDYKADPHYRFYKGNHMESHLYEGIHRSEFYDKLENVLESQQSAYKVNIALGYDLVSKTDDSDTRYFHSNPSNTSVFNAPVAINSRSDVSKVISEIRSMELVDIIKADLFAVIGTDNIKSVIKNPSYMCIATSNMKMFDISNYVPAGTSYDRYLI